MKEGDNILLIYSSSTFWGSCFKVYKISSLQRWLSTWNQVILKSRVSDREQYYQYVLNYDTIKQDFGAHILLNLHTTLWDRLLPSPFCRWNQWGSYVVWNLRRYSCCYTTTASQLRGYYCPFFLPLGVRWKLKR